MNIVLDASTIISSLIVGMLIWGIRRISKSFDDQDTKMSTKFDAVGEKVDHVKDNQAKLYTKVGEINTWKDAHDKQDDERHEDLGRQITEIRKIG